MRPHDEAVPGTARRSSRALNVTRIREDDLVEAIGALVKSADRRIILGIGDDAAVWQPSRSHRSVISTDALIENVHFRRDGAELEAVGKRAMIANLNDLAAMGARPVLATVALGLPEERPEDALALYRGISEIANTAHCTIAGGDLTRAPVLAIAITVVGEVRASHVKTRAGARPADVVAVTGPLGGSRASGYRALPPLRLAEGRWLAASAHVHAMMDLSDGLSTDLLRMCERSRCGALIERVPLAPGATEEDALSGGEDYELLVAVQRRGFKHLAARFRKRFGRELERIGIFREGASAFMARGASELPLAPSGWDHFTLS